jgi:signal peptidase I, bacterial type
MVIMAVKKNKTKEVISWLVILLVAFTLAFLINSKAYAKVKVDQSSMENTLYNKQQLIVDELHYQFHTPERGDIITFFPYEKKGNLSNDLKRYIDNIIWNLKISQDEKYNHQRYVKRVIGIEGDIIDIKDGCVYVNGKKLKEPYAKGITETNGMDTPVKVGKKELFVLGDNRVVSEDSRLIGMVKVNQVEGKVIFRLYPFNKIGKIK